MTVWILQNIVIIKAKNIVNECNKQERRKVCFLLPLSLSSVGRSETATVSSSHSFSLDVGLVICGGRETGKNNSLAPITIKHDICLLLVGYLYSKLFILISALVFNAHSHQEKKTSEWKRWKRGWMERGQLYCNNGNDDGMWIETEAFWFFLLSLLCCVLCKSVKLENPFLFASFFSSPSSPRHTKAPEYLWPDIYFTLLFGWFFPQN